MKQGSRTILLVEDHRDLAETVGLFLESQGYTVDYAADGISAIQFATEEDFDVIVLDINLPGADGLEVCRHLRKEARKSTPIIMLTARDQLSDKIQGFEVGADDYLVKPFELPELAVRIEALIRRDKGDVSETIFTVGDLQLDTEREIAIRAGKRLSLSPRSFEILRVLMRKSPAVVSRRELEKEIWGDEVPDSDALRSHVYNLRRIVDKPFDRPLIATLPGRGFCMVDDEPGD
ncbi:MAG: response regulator transcription factor [Gammaproteobacteria bacterium]|jgi:DNA-binding response OmpR family regulator|nr:response regulator transcription factor [Gammaproteobacteria bacterium]MCH1550846.1 response regulator transcription factor [Pseudomonadales bacterium]